MEGARTGITGTSFQIPVLPGDTKSDIRKRVWEHLARTGTALFPLPPHGRIPNFKGSREAGNMAASIDAFKKAKNVKVDPDKPLEQIRVRALEDGKTVFVPTPRLHTGLFNRLRPLQRDAVSLRRCATSQGMRENSVSVELNDSISIDLVVVGCVAVSPAGWRIGKGEGYSDMEFAMMVSVYSVDRDVTVVAVVHDCQVMDLPSHLFGSHDMSVDYIATPTRVIECKGRPPRPTGLLWHLLTEDKLAKIPILRELRLKEKKMGKDVCLGDKVSTGSSGELAAAASQMRAKNSNSRGKKKSEYSSKHFGSLS